MPFYPRSFSKLLFVGFALVALPLMFALVNNAISIDQLGNLSQKAVYQAVQATQSSRKFCGNCLRLLATIRLSLLNVWPGRY